MPGDNSLADKHNGLAERYVQEAKQLIAKCAADGSDLYSALLNNRNTTRGVLGSPAQRLMGRRTRGILPVSSKLLKPSIIKNVPSNLTEKRIKEKEYRDRGSKAKKPISIGQKVWFRKGHRKWSPADVIAPAQGPRSLIIKTPDGATYRRNTWFLRPNATPEKPSVSSSSDPILEETDSPDPTHCQSESPPKMSDDSGLVSADASPNLSSTPVPKIKTPVCKTDTGIKTRSGRTVKKPVKLDL